MKPKNPKPLTREELYEKAKDPRLVNILPIVRKEFSDRQFLTPEEVMLAFGRQCYGNISYAQTDRYKLIHSEDLDDSIQIQRVNNTMKLRVGRTLSVSEVNEMLLLLDNTRKLIFEASGIDFNKSDKNE